MTVFDRATGHARSHMFPDAAASGAPTPAHTAGPGWGRSPVLPRTGSSGRSVRRRSDHSQAIALAALAAVVALVVWRRL